MKKIILSALSVLLLCAVCGCASQSRGEYTPRGETARNKSVEKEPVQETPAKEEPAKEEPAKEEPVSNLVNGMRPEFVEAMDSYEAFYDSYIEVLRKYQNDPTNLTVISEYMNMLGKLDDMEKKFDAWDDGTMNDAETAYYLQVSNRILQKLAAFE